VLAEGVRIALALTLGGASIAKLASPASSRAALATFGFERPRTQAAAWTLLIALEIGLATGVAAGSDAAAFGAAGLMLLFAATLVSAIMRGRAGAPCACFGSRSTVSWTAVVRNAMLAGAFAAVPFLPGGELTTDQWLGLGLGFALLAIAGLAAAVLALAREVGMLRLRLGPDSALEIVGEGPDLGARADLVDRFDPGPDTQIALAVFLSEGCHVCRALEPAIAALGGDPLVAVQVLDEVADAQAWGALEIPGSPYAVAFDLNGTVLAKGTFNTLGQLESVIATAGRRRADRVTAGSPDG
jgi:hypothetical protein